MTSLPALAAGAGPVREGFGGEAGVLVREGGGGKEGGEDDGEEGAVHGWVSGDVCWFGFGFGALVGTCDLSFTMGKADIAWVFER